VSELKRLAKNKDIRGYYKMRKKELVQALSTEFINEVDPTSMEKIRLLLNSNPRIFELRRIAKKMGITFKRNMKKDELMERINRSLVRHEKNVQHSNSSQTTGSSSDQKIEPGPPMIPDLPKSYNTDKLVGLPVNPSWVHFYWDYSDQTLELIKRLEKRGQSLLLRIYDIRSSILTEPMRIRYGNMILATETQKNTMQMLTPRMQRIFLRLAI